MTEKEAAMIPFHALNEFMRPDFRMSVVRSTLNALPDLPDEYRIAIDKLVKKTVRIPGFRNSGKAPTALKAGPLVQTFEKNPQMVAAVLTAWAEINAPLRQQIYDMLERRGWDLLPLQAERKKLPGFFTKWPKEESFESLTQTYTELYPESEYDSDQVSLMIVWVSVRLPYELVEESPQVVTEISGLEKVRQLLEGKAGESEEKIDEDGLPSA
jgi:hypothetical protein